MGGRRKGLPVSLAMAARIFAISEEEFLRRQTPSTRGRYKHEGTVPLEAVAEKLREWYVDQEKMLSAARAQARKEAKEEFIGRLRTMLDKEILQELERAFR